MEDCRSIEQKKYLYQVLRGLEHLHRNGLFHRDVKPENILIKFPSLLYSPLSKTNPASIFLDIVLNNEIIKLADLGSVRGIFSEPPYTEYISTRWYRSPECLLTVGNYGSKMDVWATGCVFYEMITLRPLFPGSNEIDQLSKIHQVLGSPSIQSRNCIFFPKLKGTGVDALLPYNSRSGRNVLRLMIEYDPDKRINVKRLLRNCYFDDIRDDYLCVENKSECKEKWFKPEGLKRSMGDDGHLLINNNSIKPKILKRDHYFDETKKSSKESSKSGNSSKKSCSINSRIYPVEIPYYDVQQLRPGKTNLNNYTSLPLVEYQVLKSLGENPTILKPHKVLRNRPKKNSEKERLKAKSNTDTVKCDMDEKTIMRKQLQSKSFVLPRRLGQHKLDAGNDDSVKKFHRSDKIKICQGV
ncbi:hypothetical protein NQ315_012766, partial [Exocentrus adspersus]